MAPKDTGDKSSSMATIEMLTGVSPSASSSGVPATDMGSVPAKPQNSPAPNSSSAPRHAEGSGDSSTATVEMLTGVPLGTMRDEANASAADKRETVALAETLGIPVNPGPGNRSSSTQPGASAPSSFMMFPDVLAIVNSGAIGGSDGSVSLPSGSEMSWATEHPSDSVSIRTTRIFGAGLPEIEYWQRDEHVEMPLAVIGGTSYDVTTYSDGREFYKINGSADIDSMYISADGVVTISPKDPARPKLSISILDDQVGPFGDDENKVSIPTDTLSVNISNWMIAAASDGSFAATHAVGVDMAKGSTWLDRLAYKKFGSLIDKGVGFTAPNGKGAGVTGVFTLPLAIYADMNGSSQDSFARATAREVPAVVAGTTVGAVTSATVAGMVASSAAAGAAFGSALPVVGTVAGLVVGTTVGTVVAWKMSEGMDKTLPEFAAGGPVSGPGSSTSDSILAWLSDGEYVINADAARKYGSLLDAINSRELGSHFGAVNLDIESLASDSGAAGFEGAISGALAGLERGGVVNGLTSGLAGAASAAGGSLGAGIGAAIGTALGGPVGSAIGSTLGSVVGSELGGTASGIVANPIEYAAETAKEVIGTGFGLVDLAEGVGAHTARGDIYNFNGMDPKSAAIAVERVRRRRVLAQQRGGGMGR